MFPTHPRVPSHPIVRRQVGKVVNSLRHHSDPNVAALARELVASFRVECQKQWKQRKEMKATEKLNDRTTQKAISEEHSTENDTTMKNQEAISEEQTELQDLVRSLCKKRAKLWLIMFFFMVFVIF